MRRANDLTIYERCAPAWWDERAPAFRSLRSVQEFRGTLLREWLGDELPGRLVVDLGCGGGLVCAPLAAAGARVIGLDLSPASLRSARAHVHGLFVHADVRRAPLADAQAGVVLLADVLEHLEDRAAVLSEAARLLAPGGACFVSTINRTRRATWLAVHLAETIGLIPRGTHDPRLFVAPEELEQEARRCGLRTARLQGESVAVLRSAARWAICLERSSDLSVGYSALLRKDSPG